MSEQVSKTVKVGSKVITSFCVCVVVFFCSVHTVNYIYPTQWKKANKRIETYLVHMICMLNCHTRTQPLLFSSEIIKISIVDHCKMFYLPVYGIVKQYCPLFCSFW